VAAGIEAADEELSTRLYGKNLMNQREMNQEAAARHDAAMADLETLCNEIEAQTASDGRYQLGDVGHGFSVRPQGRQRT
jgi:hypothetical protein